MDQVKVYLGVAKKHHFWILSVVVVITAVVVWMQASSSLHALYENNKRTIEAAESSVVKAGAEEKVNGSFTKKVDTLHDNLKEQVFDAWKKLYERQVALFKWPVKETDDGHPIDLNNYKPDEEIPQYLRTFYNENVVKDQWEELLSRVDIRRPKESDEQTDESADGEEDEVAKRGTEYQGLVVWKDDLRKAIISRYYTPNANPSTTRLRLMQEDAWLFDSLVQVVNTVNFGATDPLRAPIKQIDDLDVAQWAIAASQQSGAGIFVPGADTAGPSGAAPPTMGMPANPMMSGAAGGASAAGGTAGASADNSDNEWKDGRYLDDKGQPLKAGSQEPFAEFRQVFVYMKFVMDQRRIPDLVAACANAPLPIETRQIRVRTLKGEGDGALSGESLFPQAGGAGPTMGGPAMGGPKMGGPTMGGPMMGPRMGGPTMGGPTMGGPTMGGPTMGGPTMGGPTMGGPAMGGNANSGGLGFGGHEGGVEITVYDAVVELSGVIYLYNAPDIAKLGSGAAGSPEKRSFGVPTTAVHVPGSSTGGGQSGTPGPMMAGPSIGK